MTELDIDSAQAIRPRAAPGGAVSLDIAQITSLEPPTFADPVSQYCTRGPTRETAFARWQRALGRADWPAVFVLQVLARWNRLLPGARAANWGDTDLDLARALAGQGIVVEAGVERDVVWALRAELSPPGLLPLVHDMLAAMRPGGLGILVFPFGANAIRRGDVERVAFELIADAHAVAALKFRGSDPALTVPFGLVFGRGSR